VGDVLLAVLAEVGAVLLDDGGRVVEEAVVLLLEDRDHDDHLGLLGEVLHEPRRRAVGDRLGVLEMLVLLHRAEVRPVEQLLEAHHLGTLLGSLAGVVGILFDHRVLVTRPLGLDDGGPNDVGHGCLLWSARLLHRKASRNPYRDGGCRTLT
jgi:hypothetical protein